MYTLAKPPTVTEQSTSFYSFNPVDAANNECSFESLRNKVVLIVNTASKCGFTPQFDGLEKLYKDITQQHGDKFLILGFPCNQFGSQDPGSNDDIVSFCKKNYGVSFPVLGKVDVNGDNAAPLFKWLKQKLPGIFGIQRVKWNFEKFLISANGEPVHRWASTTKPESIREDIEKEIAKINTSKSGESSL